MAEVTIADITVTDQPGPEVRESLGAGLTVFIDEAVGYNDRRPLAVLVRNAAGTVLGGALGRTSLGLMFLDQFHLPRELRGAGLGAEILRRFEAEGRARGCREGVLFTISFQAPGFYEKYGWVRFGEIPCDPPGASRIWFRKAL